MKKTPYDVITERVIEMLKEGTIPWRKPWVSTARQATSYATGNGYRGMNWFLLNAVMMAKGYKQPQFLTFNQINKAGGKIIKGEHGYPVTFWKFFAKKENGQVILNSKGEPETIPMLRYYTVFNAEQTEGMEFPEVGDDKQIDFNPIEQAERIVADWEGRPAIKHEGVRACYSRKDDIVRMPERDTFISEHAYYTTLFHELGHSTGHEDRLNRQFGKRFGDRAYAYEELVAEMTAAFCCGECGIAHQTLEDTGAYIKTWIHKLENDPRMVVTAAGAAQKAADMILGQEYTIYEQENQEEAA